MDELEIEESKITLFFIKEYSAYHKLSTDCSQALCFLSEMVRITITQRLSIVTPLILF